MPKYEITLSRSAEKELSSLPPKMRERAVAAIDSLQTQPRSHGVTKIRGRPDTYRFRFGDYRIIYTIDDHQQKVDVYYIRHRKEAYR